MSNLNFMRGISKDIEYYEQMLTELQRPLEDQIKAMEHVLNMTLNQARSCPILENNPVIQQIRTLDDLKDSEFYMDPNDVMPKVITDTTWQELLGNQEIVFTSKTSASSGDSKVMPFTKVSLQHSADGFAPYIAEHMLNLDAEGVQDPWFLALTSPAPFVTYYAIPKVSNLAGLNIVHVPLPSILYNPSVAQELVEVINDQDIHGMFGVAPMMPALMGALENRSGGHEAIEKLQTTSRLGMFGGSPIAKPMEDYLKSNFGELVNLFASTEALIYAASHYQGDSNVLHINTNYCIPGIIPEDSTEMLLWHEARFGTRGEIVLTLPMGIPWINFKTGDWGAVEKGNGNFTTPAMSFYERGFKVKLDVGAAKVYSTELKNGLTSAGNITDYIIQKVPPDESGDLLDRLEIWYEGDVPAEQVHNSIMEHAFVLKMILEEGQMARTAVYRVEPDILRKERQRISRELDNAAGPLKDDIVIGQRYKDMPTIDSYLVNSP